MTNAIIRDEKTKRCYEVEKRAFEKSIKDFNKALIAKIEDENSPNEWFYNFKQELDEWHKNTFNEDPLPYSFYGLNE